VSHEQDPLACPDEVVDDPASDGGIGD